jgi:hypothetical protein
MKIPPEAACGRLPLKGATPVARQSRFHGVRLVRSLVGAVEGVLQ